MEVNLGKRAEIKPAILVLEDGSVFRGTSIGADGVTVGEVVFNTAMTGYQEILTDLSYRQQIVTFTYPHIGNTGVNALDNEAASVAAAGLIVRDVPRLHSNWRARQSLPDYLREHKVIGIADVDTRPSRAAGASGGAYRSPRCPRSRGGAGSFPGSHGRASCLRPATGSGSRARAERSVPTPRRPD